jgi:addiction module HigA family antidote
MTSTKQRSAEFHPDLIVAPGEHIKELLEEKNWTQRALAARMGRPVQTISEIINGRKAITAETALQLEKVLGVSAETWLNLESTYRLALARRGTPERPPLLSVLDAFVEERDPSDPAIGYCRFMERITAYADQFGGSSTAVILSAREALTSGDPLFAEWKTTAPAGAAEAFDALADVLSK